MNRFPAVSKGAVLSLLVGGSSHLVDVLAVHGLRHIRCGRATTTTTSATATSAVDVSTDDTMIPSASSVDACDVPGACLVDADVEVDFAPSVQADAAEAARAQAEKDAQAAAHMAREAACAATAQAAKVAAAAEGAAAAERQRAAAAALSSLVSGSAKSDPSQEAMVITCAFKLPDGGRCTGSLSADAPLLALWWTLDAGGHAPPGRDFALATSFPRRRLLRPVSQAEDTLRTAGLADSKQQAFFVELL